VMCMCMCMCMFVCGRHGLFSRIVVQLDGRRPVGARARRTDDIRIVVRTRSGPWAADKSVTVPETVVSTVTITEAAAMRDYCVPIAEASVCTRAFRVCHRVVICPTSYMIRTRRSS
jgi:hypothetical protein